MAPRSRLPSASWDQRRVDEGLYDACAAQLVSMGPQALSAAVIDEHFQRAVGDKGNVEGGAEARFNIIGEIAPMSMGTALSARGNYFAKPGMVRACSILITSFCFTGFFLTSCRCMSAHD